MLWVTLDKVQLYIAVQTAMLSLFSTKATTSYTSLWTLSPKTFQRLGNKLKIWVIIWVLLLKKLCSTSFKRNEFCLLCPRFLFRKFHYREQNRLGFHLSCWQIFYFAAFLCAWTTRFLLTVQLIQLIDHRSQQSFDEHNSSTSNCQAWECR